MNNDFLELIRTRRSCRKYTALQVADADLQRVVEAGLYAPTGHGLQETVIVAVQNSGLKERLSAMNAAVMGVSSDPYYHAPTIVLVFAPADNANAFQDGSCALENMMLAAHALGLASCWINREREMFSTSEGKELMHEMGLPDGMTGIGALALGYAAEPAREAKPRKDGRMLVLK